MRSLLQSQGWSFIGPAPGWGVLDYHRGQNGKRRGEEHTRLIRNTSSAGLQDRPTSASAASAKSLQAKRRDYYDLLTRCRNTRVVVYVHQSVRYEK